MYCSQCGRSNDVASRFCINCGAPLEQPVQNETPAPNETGISNQSPIQNETPVTYYSPAANTQQPYVQPVNTQPINGYPVQGSVKTKTPAAKKRTVIIISIAAAVVVLGAIAFVVFFLNGGSFVEKQLALGKEYISAQNYEKAIEAYNKVIEKDPVNAEAYEALVYIYDKTDNESALDDVLSQINSNGLADVLPYGQVMGKVSDAEDYIEGNEDIGIEGVKITIAQEDKIIIEKETSSSGDYTFTLKAGTYTLRAEYEGYVTAALVFDVTRDKEIYQPMMKLVKASANSGTISGVVIDSLTGLTVPGAEMSIRSGDGQDTTTLVTDEYGEYTAELPAGYYTADISALGYSQLSISIIVIGDQTVTDQNGALTPILEEGQLRIVLTWGEKPLDLDSHFTGPSAEGKPFHIFYMHTTSENNGEIMADLDLDDTTSFGPETTTIYKAVEGTYSFYVHDYTNRDHENSTALANSGAKVQVYMGDSLAGEFNVPTNQVGTAWHVFDFTAGEITAASETAFDIDDLNTDAYDSGWTRIEGEKIAAGVSVSTADISAMGFSEDMTLLDLVNVFGLPLNYDSIDDLRADMEAGALYQDYESDPTGASWEYDQGITYASFDADTWKVNYISINLDSIALPKNITKGMTLDDLAAVMQLDPSFRDLGKLESLDSIAQYCKDHGISGKIYETGYLEAFLTNGCFGYSEYSYEDDDGSDYVDRYYTIEFYTENSILSLYFYEGVVDSASLSFTQPPEN